MRPLGAAPLREPLGRGRGTAARAGLTLCPSLDYLERAGRTPSRRPSEEPYIEVEVPSAVGPGSHRRRLGGDDDVHPVRAASPRRLGRGRREKYADRCCESSIGVRAERARRGAALRGAGPPDIERIFGLVGGSIFQGEQGLDQMAFMRPPRTGAVRDARRRPLCLRRRHPSGRRLDGGLGTQHGPGPARHARRRAAQPPRALSSRRAPGG